MIGYIEVFATNCGKIETGREREKAAGIICLLDTKIDTFASSSENIVRFTFNYMLTGAAFN